MSNRIRPTRRRSAGRWPIPSPAAARRLLLALVLPAPLALAAAHGTARVPPALRAAVERTLARAAAPADAVAKNGCAETQGEKLKACFTPHGVRFAAARQPPFALRLAAWGRGAALHRVAAVRPHIAGNRVRYSHGALAEWWRVLPVGVEQGFTVTKRPGGRGALMLVLAATARGRSEPGALAFGRLHYGDLVVTDAAGKVLPASLSARGERVRIAVDDSAARYPLTVDPLMWVEQKIEAGDGAAGDQFGRSVAVEGTTALVGAPDATVQGVTDQGAVYVFTESDGTWTQTQKLVPGDPEASGAFGTSVALDGTTALIGEPTLNQPSAPQGAVYVFTESGGTWSQTQKLTASDGVADDMFGYSVAMDATTAFIGAPAAPCKAYVFTDSGGTWTQTQEFTNQYLYCDYGVSAALDGNTALVGDNGATVNNETFAGVAYVYHESGGTWNYVQLLKADDGQDDYGAEFGTSVSLAGTTALIGSPYATVNGNYNLGAAFVFTESNGSWSHAGELVASDAAAYDSFGNAVALDDTTAVVGAADLGGSGMQGAAYVFTRHAGGWIQAKKLTASDGTANDRFGTAVTDAGSTLFVGSPHASVGGTNQGALYVYNVTCPQGYSEFDGSLDAGGLFAAPPYQAPVGMENAILGGTTSFRLYLRYSTGGTSHTYRIPVNEIHHVGPAGTYRWGVKAGSSGGSYVFCTLHP